MAHYANPQQFLDLSKRLWPWVAGVGAALLALGLVLGIFATPPDYQQGHSAKIMYVHVPAAWMSMFCYTVMAGSSIGGLVWRHPLADVAAKSAAPIGAVFTALALVTGAIWGKPTWGAYWVWDARLTSVLVLLFLYLGYMAIWEAIEEPVKAARAAAILAIVGVVNVPIIKFSVDWWNSIHQSASISSLDKIANPSIAPSMLWPLLITAAAYMIIFAALLMVRMRTEILSRRLRTLRLMQSARAAAVTG